MKGLIFTYILTYGGAAASLFNPFIGLLVYICFAIIRPESLWYWSVPPGNYSRIVAIALLIGWGLNGFGDWRFGRAAGVVAALLGFLTCALVGHALAPVKEASWYFTEGMAKIVLPFVVGITTIQTARQIRQLTWIVVLSQGYVALELNQAYFGGFNRLQELGFGGMDNNCYAIGLVTATGLSFVLGLGERNLWLRVAAMGTALLCGHAVLLSFSRGAMLAIIVTGLTAFFVIPKRPGHYLIFTVALVVGLRLAGPQVQERFATIFKGEESRDYSAESRLDLWKACLSCMAESPLTGLGPNHWPLVAHRYGFTVGKSAHSLWVQTAAEMGVPGLATLVAFYALTIAQLWPLRNEKRPVQDPFFREAARMVISGLTGFMVAAQFVTLHGLEIPYYTALIGAGVLKLDSRTIHQDVTFPVGSRNA